MGRQKRYTREFKLEAAKLVVERGYTYAAAAESLGMTSWSIRQWVKKFQTNGELPAGGQDISGAEELKKLRRELKQVRLEHEILKKAAAYFAKESL